MTHSRTKQRRYVRCFWIGLQLMCFALFLHPMSPEDFLLLAITTPLETLSEPYGFGMALGFWISLSLLLIGLLGWIDIGRLLKNMRPTKPPSSKILV